MKNFLFVASKPSSGTALAQELLDTILTVSAFDQQVSVLFLDEGLFLIKKSPSDKHDDKTACLFSCLSFYEISDLYVENESLDTLGISECDLILPVTLCARSDISALMSRFDVIFPF